MCVQRHVCTIAHLLYQSLSSVCHPLGFVAPFILQWKRILQDLCEENLQWNEIVPQSIQYNWKEWKRKIQQLLGINIQRCLLAKGSKQIKHCSLYHFLDTSKEGYDQVTYLQTVDKNNRIFCNIVMANHMWLPWSLYQYQDWNWLLQYKLWK